jgi:hypothetical protein
MLKLDPEVEEKLKKFGDEVRIKPIDSEVYPWPLVEGGIIRQERVDMVFRDLYLQVFTTILLKKGVGWLSQLMSLRGSVGMIACTILFFSKFLGQEPKIIYMDRDTRANITDITAEWYRWDVDLDWRMEMHKAFGFKAERMIQFKDVVEEARRFLDEWYR